MLLELKLCFTKQKKAFLISKTCGDEALAKDAPKNP